MTYPTNHQSLFEFAIESRRAANARSGGYYDAWVLRHWAKGYARANHLKRPLDYRAYGIVRAPSGDETIELAAEGLL